MAKVRKNEFETFARHKPELTVLTDHPLTDTQTKDLFELDPFNFRFKLGPVFDILRHPDTKTPTAILISGGWGTGKTSAMKWLHALLGEWNKQKPGNVLNKEYIKVRPIWFYPWKYDNREDVRRGIIASVILNAIDVKTASWKIVKKAIKLISTFFGKSTLDLLERQKLSIEGFELSGGAIKKIIKNFREATHPEVKYQNPLEAVLEAWVKDSLGKNQRLVIFIDDLDRCMPDIALQVLEALKLYLNIPNLIFILGVDRDVVEKLVVEHYRKLGLVRAEEKNKPETEEDKVKAKRDKIRRQQDEEKAKLYLSKMFQVEVELSPSEKQINQFFEDQLKEITYWKDEFLSAKERNLFSELILKYAKRNPREIKRLLNSSLMSGAGAELLEEKIEFRQGVQLFFVRKILNEKYTMASEAGSKRGIGFFVQWSQIVYKSLSENIKVPLNVYITSDLKQKISEVLNRSYEISQKDGINNSEFVENYLNEALFGKEDFSSIIPSEYHTLLKDKNNLELLHLLSDIDLGQLMQIPYPEEAAEVIVEDKLVVSDFVKVSIGHKLNKKPADVTPSDYEQLTELDLSNSSLSDLEEIKIFTNLQKLFLNETEVSDLEPIRLLNKLQRLDLNKTRILDIRPLSELAELRELFMHYTSVSDLEPLRNLTNLVRLGINNTLVSNIEPLKNLTNLEALDLDKDKVSDLEPLMNLKSLQRLYLRNTQVSDINPLAGLANLQLLFLHHTSISNLEPLKNLTQLIRLGINNTSIFDLEPLINLSNLQALDLTKTEVSNLKPLMNLKSLQRLYLAETKISDVLSLELLTNLQLLDLVNTNIEDLEPLKELKNLKEVRLLECKNITVEKIIDLQQSLPNCRILSALKEDFIINNSFRLIFNPESPQTKNKIMKFANGGVITEGNNNNEATWRIKKGYLELLNSEGKIHSRFYYNPVTNRFDHTNDKDTRSIRDQYMILA